MGFLKKIFKPVSKVLDKIVPNEIKPLLPYAAAFAPMFAPGIMGSTMLSRGLMAGGLNLGSQLAQEGSEGDVNMLSALMAGGIGALSAPQVSKTNMASPGDYFRMRSEMAGGEGFANQGLDFLGKSADFIGGGGARNKAFEGSAVDILGKGGTEAGFNMATAKAAAIPLAQATGDLAYADAQRALRDFENSQGGGSGYAEGDQNRGLAVRRAMERGGHDEQTIQDMLESLGYEDPDPQDLAYGGRVNAMGSGIMSNQRGLVNQPGGYAGLKDAATNTILHRFGSKYDRPTSSGDSLEDKITESQLADVLKYDFQGPAGVMGLEESLDMITPESVSRSAMKMQRDGDLNFNSMNKNKPDFNDMPKVLENVKTAQVEEVSEIVELDDLSKLEGFAQMLSNMDESDPKYNSIRQMAISEAEMVGEKYQISPVDLVGYLDTKTDMFKEKTTEDGKKEMLMESIKNTSFGFADGGVTSVLPEGMEMDYRGGGFIPMGSKERADDVPARVSKNEFVMTADAVKAAGGGSVNQGAKKMYDLMNNLEARA